VSLTLTITDNADGTGVSASCVYSTGGTVSLYKATVSASGIGSYSVASTRSNTGAFTFSPAIATGYYAWYATAGSDTTTVVRCNATDEGDSVHERCLTMISDRIAGLNLTNVNGNTLTVYKRQMNDESNVSYPAFILSIAGQPEDILGGNNQEDDIGYNVTVSIVERCAAETDIHRARYLMWRDRIRAALHNKPGSRFDARVPECWNCIVKPGAVIDIPETKEQADYRYGLLTVQCVCRVRRQAA